MAPLLGCGHSLPHTIWHNAVQGGVSHASGIILTAALRVVATSVARADDRDGRLLSSAMARFLPAAAFQTELTDNDRAHQPGGHQPEDGLGRSRASFRRRRRGLVITITADRTGGSPASSEGNARQSNAQVNIKVDTSQNQLLGGSTQAPDEYRAGLSHHAGDLRSRDRPLCLAGPDHRREARCRSRTATDPMVEKLASALEKSRP